jgi:hypothetical protein
MDEQTTPLEGKNPLLAATFEAQLDGKFVLRPGLFGFQAHGCDLRLNSLTFPGRKCGRAAGKRWGDEALCFKQARVP